MPKWTNEQEGAIKKRGSNIIVSAGAGSGKTAVLSERVLEIVRGGTSVLDLIILTFTRAAATEMKDRIRSKLKKNGLEEEANKIDLAYITTFDSFSLSLVKKYSYLLNIDKNINILDNSILNLKIEETLDNIFENLYKENDSKFLKLIKDFTLKDDTEIKSMVVRLYNSINNLIDKDTYNKYYVDYFKEENIENLVNEYMSLIKENINYLKDALNNLSYYTDSDFNNKIYEVLNPLFNSMDYLDIKRNALVRLPVLRGGDEEVKKKKEEVKDILDNIVNLTKYDSLEYLKESIIKTKDYVEEVIYLINSLDKELMEYKKKYNSYEFSDIARMAIKLLQDNKDICNELKYTYKEILVDEYQDTSDIQDMLINLISNNNIYMVGDIKQSIYRFRNANPSIFKSKYDLYSKNINGIKIDLNKNFRSRREVLDSVNLIFNLIMDNYIGGALYKDNHQMQFGLTLYDNVVTSNYDMSILNYEYDKDNIYSKSEIEIFMIAKDIKSKIDSKYTIMDKETNKERYLEYSDIAILLDRSTDFILYKKIFEYLGIPLNIIRDDAISDSEDISIIKNIYNIIISIRNKDYSKKFVYSFVAVCRSYLFNISDKEILKIINDRDYANTSVFKIAYPIAKELDSLNNQELFNLIIDRFCFYEKVSSANEIDKHLTVIESINSLIKSSNTLAYTPIDFYDFLDKVYSKGIDIKLSLSKSSGSAVKLMTIHASKGLEYPICYMAGLYKKFNIDDLKSKFYFDKKYGFITPYIDNSIKSSFIKILLKNKYIEEEISEKLRLFYVAVTRAREKIILVGSFSKNELAYKQDGIIDNICRMSYRSFQDILNSIYDYIDKYIENIDIDSLNINREYKKTKVKDITKLIKETTKIEVEDINIKTTLKEEKHYSKESHTLLTKNEYNNINLGKRMHRLLENINFDNPDYSNMNSFEKGIIETFISSGILDNYVKLYKEYEFIYSIDNIEYNGIIDLLIIKKDEVIIVDYKLKSITDKAYLKQLEGYKKYIESITGSKVITYLYSLLDGKLVRI